MTDEYKKRILFCGEASFLNTGFSTYYRELLPRLVETGKYEIAEFGSYATDNDTRVASFIQGRWKFYGGMPQTEEEKREFEAANMDPAQPNQQLSQFGRWRFERVLSDFRPDIVVDIRDWWMLAYQQRSPLRKYFQWVIMPTVDSIPQREEWINTYTTADYVAAYSDFGVDSLRKSNPHLEVRFNPPNVDVLGVSQLHGSIDASNLNDIRKPGKLHPVPLRPGVDVETFHPMDKGEVRAKWGLRPDNPVILLVQRNQARKRINEAIQAFALMKEKYKGNPMVDKAIMILHTSWPDNLHSSDYPRCIERTHRGYHGIPYSHPNIFAEVLNTFLCNNPQCGNAFLAHAIHLRNANPQNGYTIECPNCKQQSARPCNTGVGYTREQLAEVYNMGDILLQMSIAEGCGMPVQEAKACGTMVLVTDYAAIAEKGKVPDYEHIDRENYTLHRGGDLLERSYLYEEPETNCWRAHTSIEDTAEQMAHYLMNEGEMRTKQVEARECAVEHYDWNKLAANWEFILDKKGIQDRAETWDKPAVLIDIDMSQPDPAMSDEEFVDWCYTRLLGYTPETIDQKGKSDWIRTLAVYRENGKQDHECRQLVVDFFRNEANNINNIEKLRAGLTTTDVANDESDSDTISAMVIV